MASYVIRLKGGDGSGHFDHRGIPDHQGGSLPNGTSSSSSSSDNVKKPEESNNYLDDYIKWVKGGRTDSELSDLQVRNTLRNLANNVKSYMKSNAIKDIDAALDLYLESISKKLSDINLDKYDRKTFIGYFM